MLKLILLLLAICSIGYNSEAILRTLGVANTASAPSAQSTQSRAPSIQSPAVQANKKPAGMSLAEYAELAKTDPEAYRKLMQSHQQEQERSEVDKLMNFFTRLKYE